MITLKDGAADVTLQLRQQPFPDAGNYLGGSLTIDSAEPIGMSQISIPVSVQIDVVKLITAPTSQSLSSGNARVYSAAIKISTDKPVKLGEEAGQVQVELLPLADAGRFTAAELWLERLGAPEPQRAQKLNVSLNEEFRVGFQPETSDRRVGVHSYVWEATASQGLVMVRGDLSLKIAPPRLVVAEKRASAIVSRGNRTSVSTRFKFDRAVDGDWYLYFKPEKTERDHVVFAGFDGTAGETSKIHLDFPTSTSAFPYKGKTEAAFVFEASVPSDHRYGSFVARGTLQGPRSSRCRSKSL